ncbi:hypothetical protein [Paraburkholderia acidiphila]|uniref:Uncharacterized protein n=1 Tax=Paraburkholderia acidiphila TaxID=2571747 RepID=A0A7Z2G9L2_9BURK|nr:hypothetical protein [Paraburkholderia acidiphila]QGZ57718.1 hypothetical protein FAZ97_22770 [Paraburkholderia acidiphila]
MNGSSWPNPEVGGDDPNIGGAMTLNFRRRPVSAGRHVVARAALFRLQEPFAGLGLWQVRCLCGLQLASYTDERVAVMGTIVCPMSGIIFAPDPDPKSVIRVY